MKLYYHPSWNLPVASSALKRYKSLLFEKCDDILIFSV